MKRARAGLGPALLLILAAAGRVATEAAPAEAARASAAEEVIRRWSEGPRDTARLMIVEYGPPESATWRALRWTGNGPWVKTIVRRSAWPRLFGPRKKDWLEQTVSFLVPARAVDDLLRFDERVEVNRRAGELSALSPNEGTNILLLNLAHEIATGRRDVPSARAFAARTEALARAGNSSPYTERLLFPSRAKSRDTRAMAPAGARGYTEPEKGGSHE